MKKLILILLAIFTLAAPVIAPAQSKTYTVLLAGGEEANAIQIWLSPDGREYVIDSLVQLDIGGTICTHPAGNPNELVCSAPLIAGFEVNAGGNHDRVAVAKQVSVPVTMRGGAGRDMLAGGGGPDKLIGGYGSDRLAGGYGDDFLLGGEGDDVLIGGPGDDVLRGGYGKDKLIEGRGTDSVHQQYRAEPAALSLGALGGLAAAQQPAADEEERDQEADQRERRVEAEGGLDPVDE